MTRDDQVTLLRAWWLNARGDAFTATDLVTIEPLLRFFKEAGFESGQFVIAHDDTLPGDSQHIKDLRLLCGTHAKVRSQRRREGRAACYVQIVEQSCVGNSSRSVAGINAVFLALHLLLEVMGAGHA